MGGDGFFGTKIRASLTKKVVKNSMLNSKSKSLVILVMSVLVAMAGYYFFVTKKGIRMDKDTQTLLDTPAKSNQELKGNILKSLGNYMHHVTIETNQGVIQLDTYDADAPKTVKNFLTLAEKGFYNSLIFHRVVSGFVIQGGDPNCSLNPSEDKGLCGTGGPGYSFEDELNPETESYKEGYKKGVVAMANSGPHTNGSQFFIMLEAKPLPHQYSIFGKVVGGQDVVDVIGRAKVGKGDRPLDPVLIKTLRVEKRAR